MQYCFKYQTKATDLWQLTMYGIYGSMMGTINIIFTVAMLLLAYRFWQDMNLVLKMLCILGVLLFLLIQPTLIYLRSLKQAGQFQSPIELDMDDEGLHIYAGLEKSFIPWYLVKGISKKPTLLVIFASNQHGYVLSNNVLKADKMKVYEFVQSKLTQES